MDAAPETEEELVVRAVDPCACTACVSNSHRMRIRWCLEQDTHGRLHANDQRNIGRDHADRDIQPDRAVEEPMQGICQKTDRYGFGTHIRKQHVPLPAKTPRCSATTVLNH